VSESISVLSTEYDRWAISAASDPRADVVELAYLTPGTEPTESDWHTASWEASTLVVDGVTCYVVALLLGYGGLELEVGEWSVWVRVTDDPTIPVKPLGTIVVY